MYLPTGWRIIVLGSLLLGLLGCGASAEGEQGNSQKPISQEERQSIPGLIAFIAEHEGQEDIYLLAPSGQELRRLTRSASAVYPVMQMPGDSLLLAISVTEDSLGHREQLMLVPLDTSQTPRRLYPASERVRYPSVTPNGEWVIVAASFDSFRDIYRIQVSSDSLQRLTENKEGNFGPEVAPDGRSIAFTSSRDQNSEIYRMNLDGSEQERLTHFHRDDWDPRWSPDGQQIAFLSDRQGKDRLFVMAANGDRQRKVNADSNITAQDSLVWQEAQHAWSPTGEEIAYVRQRPQGPSQVWVTHLASGQRRQLSTDDARDDSPNWSPDGQYLVIVAEDSAGANLYLMRADGTGRTLLTQTPGDDWLPRWLPGEALPPQTPPSAFP